MPTVLPVQKGISSYAVGKIPVKWESQWFKYFIDNFLAGADIRNVTAGSGISVNGNVSGNGTNNTGSGVTIAQTPIANNTVLGNVSGITASPVGLTQAQLTTLVNIFTSALSGAAPASGGGTINFLRADGIWAVPAGSAAIPNNTVLGNISGGVAAPVALTQAQLTALVNVFTAGLSGAVPASSGGTTTWLRADGTFTTVPVPVGANPTASTGLTAIPGVALTFLRSDGSPALDVGISPTWTGSHTFNQRIAATAGLTVSGNTFISRGISDSATATALTLASTGALTITAPTATNSALTINGANTAVANIIVSGLNGTTGGADLSIRRAGSTANNIEQGPSLDLSDTSATTATSWQHSGGQSEWWQFNAGAWHQILRSIAIGTIQVQPPVSIGQSLTVTGFANAFGTLCSGSAIAGQSFALLVRGGTNATDIGFEVQNVNGTGTFMIVSGDGTVTVSPSGANGSLITTNAALTNNAGAGTGTITNAPAAGNPTKWIKINDNGTIRSIPAW